VVDSGKEGPVKYKFILVNAKWKCDQIKKYSHMCNVGHGVKFFY
jgi:hypothetical protein